jgi:hypothetical protein
MVKNMEGSGHDLVGILSRNLSGETEETTERSVRKADVADETRMEHLPNKNLKRYL